MVHALNARNGETVWTYATGNKIFSAPFITSQLVVVTSCDGFISCTGQKTMAPSAGNINTDYPIVACPAVAGGNVYTGSSNGKFYSIRLANGTLNWVADGLNGYIESRPAIDGTTRIYIGTWGAMFYAIDRRTGEKVWKFDTGRGRYFSPGACWPVVLPYRKDGKVIGAGHRTQFRLLRTRLQPRRRENPLGIGRSERTRITRLLPGRKDNVHKRHQEQHYGSQMFQKEATLRFGIH